MNQIYSYLMHYIFLASVLNIHFAIIGNVALYFVAGLEAVAVAFFLGAGCSLLYYFVAVVVVDFLRGALLRGILPSGVLLLELLLV